MPADGGILHALRPRLLAFGALVAVLAAVVSIAIGALGSHGVRRHARASHHRRQRQQGPTRARIAWPMNGGIASLKVAPVAVARSPC
jgi:hypothetical protein